MKLSASMILLAAQLVMLGCSQGPQTGPRNSLQERLDSVAQEVETGRVREIEIMQINANTSFITQVTPEVLANGWDYRFTIRSIDRTRRAKLAAALRSARPEQVTESADLRSGVIFYSSARDEQGKRIGALYFDRTGNSGALDDTPVSFAQGFARQLMKALLPPYE